MMIPIDTATGLQAGSPVHTGAVDVLVGYLATHANGYAARLGPDRARAELYAAQQRATLEPMFVHPAVNGKREQAEDIDHLFAAD